jgi:hypothetical protein
MEHYNVVGQNNRNLLVQSKRLAPFHEDITRRQVFEPSSVRPGETARIKVDFKHAMDRELILNDIRLRFSLDLSARTNVGEVYCVRGTDLIRELVVKINEDVVFKVDKSMELTHLWLMNNHKMGAEVMPVKRSFLMNHGVIPPGLSPPFFYDSATQGYGHAAGTPPTRAHNTWTRALQTQRGLERHDGLPRLIYSDLTPGVDAGTTFTTTNVYRHFFDISLHQLVGPIFHRLHLRRIEFIQMEIMFEPFVSQAQTQNFLLFRNNPVASGAAHPYSAARFTDLEIRQYRTTVLDGIHGFSLPDNRMLSWLMHRFTRRDYTFNFDTMKSIDIQLQDWEVRTNIVRLYWMFAPLNNQPSGNGFAPYAAPTEPYDFLSGVEILWKNDKVLDLDTIHQVYRHYTMAENKRYGLEAPHIHFERLLEAPPGNTRDDLLVRYQWNEQTRSLTDQGRLHYEMPVYFVDLHMNIMHGVPGAELIGGIVNDTADYVIRLKRVMNDDSERTNANLSFAHSGTRTLYVWLEYQTLVNLAGGSNQFNRGSQVVTKQLNLL